MKKNKALRDAEAKATEWLSAFDLALEVDTDSTEMPDDKLGEYELGSVFEKTILIRVNLPAIKKACKENPEISVEDATATTVFHEVGHALVEQLVDWMENIPDADSIFTEEFCTRYEAVVDDALDEEDLVEDFAWCFLNERKHVLQACFEELNDTFKTT